MKFKISKSQWTEMGKKAGWMKEDSSLMLPAKFQEKLVSFPESSMGAMTVKLALGNGQSVRNVKVNQNGTILWIGDKRIERSEDLAFKTSDVIDISSDK